MIIEQKAVFDTGAKKLIFNNARRNSTFKRNKVILAAAGAILIAGGILWMNDVIFQGINKAFAVAVIILGAILFGILAATYVFLWTKIGKDSASALSVNCTYKLDDGGLTTRTNVGKNSFSWDKLKVEDRKDYIEVIVEGTASSIFLKKEKLKEKEIKWLMSDKSSEKTI